MCIGMLSIFALTMLSLLGWVAYEVGKKIWENKLVIGRSAVTVFNLPESTYQAITAKQTNV